MLAVVITPRETVNGPVHLVVTPDALQLSQLGFNIHTYNEGFSISLRYAAVGAASLRRV